jgi:HSP20 family protein
MNYLKLAPSQKIVNDWFYGSQFPSFPFTTESASFVPSVNIVEDEKMYQLHFNAPGFEKEDFKIKVENGSLLVSAEHKTESKEETKRFTRQEFRYGSFSRSFRLPKDKVNEDGVLATYKNGILTVEIPKKEQEIGKPVRTIEVA